jgi:PDGLE domain
MSRRTTVFLIGGLLVAILLAVGVSQFASSQPDGLEKVSAEEGIDRDVLDHSLGDSPFADYGTSGVDNARVGTGIAGFVGVFLAFGAASGAVWLAVKLRGNRAPAPSDTSDGADRADSSA